MYKYLRRHGLVASFLKEDENLTKQVERHQSCPRFDERGPRGRRYRGLDEISASCSWKHCRTKSWRGFKSPLSAAFSPCTYSAFRFLSLAGSGSPAKMGATSDTITKYAIDRATLPLPPLKGWM